MPQGVYCEETLLKAEDNLEPGTIRSVLVLERRSIGEQQAAIGAGNA